MLISHVDFRVRVEAVAVHLALDLCKGNTSHTDNSYGDMKALSRLSTELSRLDGERCCIFGCCVICLTQKHSPPQDSRRSIISFSHLMLKGCWLHEDRCQQHSFNAILLWEVHIYLHELLHGGGGILLARALDQHIVLGPHKPAD